MNLETMKFDTERLPEVEQFKNLIGDGYRRFTGEDVLQISDIFANFRYGLSRPALFCNYDTDQKLIRL